MNMPQSFGSAMGFSLSETLLVANLPGLLPNASNLQTSDDGVIYLAPITDTNKCWPIRPTLRNELDTFSVHFYVFFGPNISIPPDRAAVFAINLMPLLDSGGVLNMELKLNMVSASVFTLIQMIHCFRVGQKLIRLIFSNVVWPEEKKNNNQLSHVSQASLPTIHVF